MVYSLQTDGQIRTMPIARLLLKYGRLKISINHINPVTVDISLIFTLCRASLIVRVNLSTAVTNFACYMLETSNS